MKLHCINMALLLFLSGAYAQERAVNYDESKAGSYDLPDILKTVSKKNIATEKQWETVRRPEILSLFENEVYGQMPESFDGLIFSDFNSNPNAMDGKAHMKQVQIHIYRNKDTVRLGLTLFVPNDVQKPLPAFLLINNRPKYHTDPTRYIKSGFWPAEVVIDAGYAIASFQVDDAAPDDEEKYAQGVLELYPEQLQMKNGMKAIGAWAWAASRVLDYFELNDDIDASKVALVGHSRGGKASLWAAAKDKRFAIVVSNNSGNTGAALSRRNFGETVEIINSSFPHWFSENYKKYNGKEENLPVDQHMLIGLIAPRPVYVTSASRDLWADPRGTFLALKEAEPVYDLYKLLSAVPDSFPEGTFLTHEEMTSEDKPDLTAPETLQHIKPVINTPIGYHIRTGKHNLTEYDWFNFIKFADLHFNKR